MAATVAVRRQLAWNSPLTWIVVLATFTLLAIGIRAVLAPSAAAAGFGVPLTDSEGLIYVQMLWGERR